MFIDASTAIGTSEALEGAVAAWAGGESPARTGLDGVCLPRIGKAAFARALLSAEDSRRAYDKDERLRVARWLLHACASGLTTSRALARAVESSAPFFALDTLFIRTLNQQARALERRVREFCPDGYRNDFVSLQVGSDVIGRVCLSLYFDGLNAVGVTSLRRAPEPLAALAYEALRLVSASLFHAVLPHDLPRESWHLEELHDEYRALLAAGVASNAEAAREFIETNGLEWFSYHAADLEEILEVMADYHRTMQGDHPRWYRYRRIGHPAREARVLLAAVAALRPAFRRSAFRPWLDYARVCAQAVHELYAPRGAWARHKKAVSRLLTDGDTSENPVPAGYGLCVSTFSACERHVLQAIHENIMNGGETPMLSLDLGPVADPDIGGILDTTACGIGLLLRAGAVNDRIPETTD